MEDTQMRPDTISIRELLETIWQGKILIAIITAIALAISVITSFVILPEKYVASISITAAPIEIKTQAAQDAVAIVDNLAKLPGMTIEQYVQQVKTGTVLEKTAQAVNEAGVGESISAGQLAGMINVSNAANSNNILIQVTDTDPQRAARIANEIGTQYVQNVTENYNEKSQEVLDSISEQLEVERENLTKISEELSSFIRENGSFELLKAETDELVLQIVRYKTDINNYNTMIKSDAGAMNTMIEYAQLDIDLDLSDFLLNVNLDDATTQMSATMQEIVDQLQINLSSSKLSSVLQQVEFNKVQMRLLSSIQSRQAAMDDLTQMEEKLQQNQLQLAKVENQYGVLRRTFDLARQTYQTYQLRHREAQLTVSSSVIENSITIAGEASIPGSPVSPNKKLNAAIGLVLGLLLGVFVVIFRDYWKKSSPSSAR